MRHPRRAMLAALLCAPAVATAQEWPNRPIRLVVSFPPGGSTDVLGRLVAPHIERALGQTVVIENRGGANGAVASAAVAGSNPDGYTFLLDSGGAVTNAFLMRGLGFDYATAFAPVTQLTLLPSVLMVKAGSPHDTIQKLVAHLRANPGKESYGSSGIGTGSHLSGALLMRRAALDAQHVPYRGGAQQMASLLAGETLFTFSTLAVPAPLIADRQVVAIAASSATRIPGFKNVPTVAESGYPGFEMVDMHGISAPMGTPHAAIRRVADAAMAAMADPGLRSRFQALGLVPHAQGPEAFATYLATQRERMGAFIRSEGIMAEG